VTGASIGNLLRGYDLNRFAGDSSLVANTELSVSLGRFNSVLPFRYGLTGLADVGRVFVHDESSSKWHAGYGGGIWLGIFASGSTFQFASALKAALVHSDEGTSFYLLTGFGL
jgi:hemolysin activation/secretion protein